MVAPVKRKSERDYIVQSINKVLISHHHFFVIDEDIRMLADKEGKVLVFTNFDHALAFAAGVPELCNGFKIVCMGDSKWELFKQTEEYIIIGSNESGD